MPLGVDPALSSLFGSENRVRTLAPLASSPVPLTAYRIAKMVDVPRTKVYLELAELAARGWVRRMKVTGNRSVWELTDPDVRRLLRRRARIDALAELSASWADLAARTRSVLAKKRRSPIDPSLLRGSFTPRNPEDFARSDQKDAGLRSMGLPVSRRARRAR